MMTPSGPAGASDVLLSCCRDAHGVEAIAAKSLVDAGRVLISRISQRIRVSSESRWPVEDAGAGDAALRLLPTESEVGFERALDGVRQCLVSILPAGTLHAVDGQGRSPFLVCCMHGHVYTASLLLRLGVGLASRDKDLASALHLAAVAIMQQETAERALGKMDAFATLIAANAARSTRLLESRDLYGRTPLLVACAMLPGPGGHSDRCSSTTGMAGSLMTTAAWTGQRGSVVGARMVELLLDAGSDAFARDASDMGVFDYASASGDLATVRLILQHPRSKPGMDPDAARPGAFLGVLLRAVRAGDVALCGTLLDREPALATAHELDASETDTTRAGAGGGGLRRKAMLAQAFAPLQQAPKYGDERPVLPDVDEPWAPTVGELTAGSSAASSAITSPQPRTATQGGAGGSATSEASRGAEAARFRASATSAGASRRRRRGSVLDRERRRSVVLQRFDDDELNADNPAPRLPAPLPSARGQRPRRASMSGAEQHQRSRRASIGRAGAGTAGRAVPGSAASASAAVSMRQRRGSTGMVGLGMQRVLWREQTAADEAPVLPGSPAADEQAVGLLSAGSSGRGEDADVKEDARAASVSGRESVLSGPEVDARAAAAADIPLSNNPMTRTAAAKDSAATDPRFTHWVAAPATADDADDAVDNAGEDAGGRRRTGLMLAAACRQHEVARLLLDRGAAVNATDAQGRTALHHAVVGGSAHMARMLLAEQADTSTRDSWGRSALEMVVGGETSEPLWSPLGTLLMDRAGPTDMGLGPGVGGGGHGAGLPTGLLDRAVRAMAEARADRKAVELVLVSLARPNKSEDEEVDAQCRGRNFQDGEMDVAAAAAAAREAEAAEREADTEEARRIWARQGAERASRGLFSLFRSTWRRAKGKTGGTRKGNRSVLLADGASYVEPPKGTAFSAPGQSRLVGGASKASSALGPGGREELRIGDSDSAVLQGRESAVLASQASVTAAASARPGAYATDPVQEERDALRAWAAKPAQTPGESLAAMLPPRHMLERFGACMRATLLAAGASGWCAAALSETKFPASIVGLVAADADRALLPLPAWLRAGLNARWAFRDLALPDIPAVFAAGGGTMARGGEATSFSSAALRAGSTASHAAAAQNAGGPTDRDAMGLGGLAALVMWMRSRTWPAGKAPPGPAVDGSAGLASLHYLQERQLEERNARAARQRAIAHVFTPSAAVAEAMNLSSKPKRLGSEWSWDVFARCPRLALALLSADHVCMRSLGQLRAVAASVAGRQHIQQGLVRAQVPTWAITCLFRHLEADLHSRSALALIMARSIGPASVGVALPKPNRPPARAGTIERHLAQRQAAEGDRPQEHLGGRSGASAGGKPGGGRFRPDQLAAQAKARSHFGAIERLVAKDQDHSADGRGRKRIVIPAAYAPGPNGYAVPARQLGSPVVVGARRRWDSLPVMPGVPLPEPELLASSREDDERTAPSEAVGGWADKYAKLPRRTFGARLGSQALSGPSRASSVSSFGTSFGSSYAREQETAEAELPHIRGPASGRRNAVMSPPSPLSFEHEELAIAAALPPVSGQHPVASKPTPARGSLPSSAGKASQQSGGSIWPGVASVADEMWVPGRHIATPQPRSHQSPLETLGDANG